MMKMVLLPAAIIGLLCVLCQGTESSQTVAKFFNAEVTRQLETILHQQLEAKVTEELNNDIPQKLPQLIKDQLPGLLNKQFTEDMFKIMSEALEVDKSHPVIQLIVPTFTGSVTEAIAQDLLDLLREKLSGDTLQQLSQSMSNNMCRYIVHEMAKDLAYRQSYNNNLTTLLARVPPKTAGVAIQQALSAVPPEESDSLVQQIAHVLAMDMTVAAGDSTVKSLVERISYSLSNQLGTVFALSVSKAMHVSITREQLNTLEREMKKVLPQVAQSFAGHVNSYIGQQVVRLMSYKDMFEKLSQPEVAQEVVRSLNNKISPESVQIFAKAFIKNVS